MNESKCNNLSAPLGSATQGRLIFASGAAGVNIQADSTLPGLYRAHFEHYLPGVRVQDGMITIQYRHFPFFDWLAYWREPVADIKLNGAIPWQFEFRGGVSKLMADLRGLKFEAIDMNGGVSQVVLILPPPSGAVPIYIVGGVSSVTIHRPPDTAARVQVGSGASSLIFDEQQFGPLGGDTHLETPNYKSAGNRYDIRVMGGASNLIIEAK